MEKPFCQLCGKYKTDEMLKKVSVSPPSPLTEKIIVEMCFDCDRVLFNMNRILTDNVRKQMDILREIDKDKRIITPLRGS